MVVTSWRSGSTLIGELLNSVPNSFYSYEPLSHAGIRRIFSSSEDQIWSKSAHEIMQGLINCNFSSVINECKLKY